MIDNDYRLPSYISPSDSLTIPGVDRSGLSPEMQAVLDVTATLRSGAAQIPLVTGESTNGELDRRTEIVRADEGWVETPEATGPPSEGFYRILAMDCEMVRRRSCLPVISAENWFHRS